MFLFQLTLTLNTPFDLRYGIVDHAKMKIQSWFT